MARSFWFLVFLVGIAWADEWEGKVFCGYQGWFRCEGDGGKVGWRHYGGPNGPTPEQLGIEIWPAVDELPASLRRPTPFRHRDGKVAEVFSSLDPEVTRLHFRWMREYGVDAAFLQRFATETRDPVMRRTLDQVLTQVDSAATAEGRQWALMYDTSGLPSGPMEVLKSDLARLLETSKWDPHGESYLKIGGKPVVATWGIGFGDRQTDFAEWQNWVDHLHDKGFAVMLGVPYYWRTLDRDAVGDARLHEVLARADVISPWAVGRLGTPDDAERLGREVVAKDVAWCREKGVRYLPVLFPGFSWHHLMRSRGQKAEFDAIPRLGGRFLWSQAVAAKKAGSDAVYLAMFDEMDEGTALMKFDPDPPLGAPFLEEGGVPKDRYLRVAGAIGGWLRNERSEEWPSFPDR
ncbi:hypothetical protein HNR46_000225 [Haloferula luteola]|uniref:Xylosidase/arabinosidase n=1 Tax=Haloferula luteola TaxID=595692 RepID=A0A840V2W5_9BACT|nr:glycoside hydrolase family 71/99-like protein [Haloferula luteola]MBB5350004.1 hypothetical protein [Haloferula luteola]